MGDAIDTATARMRHESDTERLRREQRDHDARGNLAAMCCDWYHVDPATAKPGQIGAQLAARDFKLLADMLGLERP